MEWTSGLCLGTSTQLVRLTLLSLESDKGVVGGILGRPSHSLPYRHTHQLIEEGVACHMLQSIPLSSPHSKDWIWPPKKLT